MQVPDLIGINGRRYLDRTGLVRHGAAPRDSPAPQAWPCLPAISRAGMLDLMNEVTRILGALEQGDLHAAEQLLPFVYDELRRLAAQKVAREAPGHARRRGSAAGA